MDKQIFFKLQNHVFDKGNPWDIWEDKSIKRENKLPYFSTWTIWNDNDLEDVSLITSENADRLKPNIVFVALNFSNPLRSDWKEWQNIHGIERMYKLLYGTKFEGAYITDIVKDFPCSKSYIVKKEIDTNKERRDRNIECFFEEMDLLGAASIEMFLLGGITEEIFKKYVMKHEKFTEFSKRLKNCRRIHHYSKENRGDLFERNAPAQLGLKSNTGAKIYEPLWSLPFDDIHSNENIFEVFQKSGEIIDKIT